MSDTTGRELLAKYGPTFGDVIGNLERELSAANARIAELEAQNEILMDELHDSSSFDRD